VYGITASGKMRFQQLLEEQFAAEGSVAQTLYAAMLFLHLSDLPEVAERLRERIARETRGLQELAEIRKQYAPVLSTGGLHLLNHLGAQRRLDRKWLREVLSDVEKGKVRDVPDPKKLGRKRAGRLGSKIGS
jgi:hypothetical protein